MRRPPSPPPELPGLHYVRLLGSGGFADVFLYEQAFPKREVAVKVLLADELTTATRESFVAEANLMAQLSTHPFIVTIHVADISADGRPYLTMEYCSGLSLAEQYKRQPLSVEDALRTGIRISGAVATAHAAGVLHRDIKPGNILTNGFGWPALTDFGIASALEDELPLHTTTRAAVLAQSGSTSSGSSAVGMSIPWSPPEMFKDEPDPDVRSDVFSLAATVYTLVAGRTPFEAAVRSNSAAQLIARIERGEITPLQRDDVSSSFAAVLGKGMAGRREDRYATAVDFGRALQRIEIELGYAPTALDVPHTRRGVPEAPSDVDGLEATQIRLAASVPRVPAPPAPVPAGPPAPRPWAPAPAANTAPITMVEQTMLRAPAPPAAAGGGAGAGASRWSPGSATEPAVRRSPSSTRRSSGILIAVGALVLAAIAAAIVIGSGILNPTVPGPGADGPAAPAVVFNYRSDAEILFSMRNDDFVEGDYFRVTIVNGDAQPVTGSYSHASVVFSADTDPDVFAMPVVCIEVTVVRDGVTSPATQRCDNEAS